MPTPANADEFVDLIRKSGVVEEGRLTAYLQQLQAGSGIPKDVSKFAGLFVRDGLLTYFQAEQFLLGKWKRFTIGKYKVLERIGSGGMGQVFLCEHKLMRRKVAVKVLPTAKAEDSSSLERFYREARAVAALDHANIVRAYDIDQDENLHFLVMEYVDGASLQDLVKKFGPMDVTRACHYIYWSAIGLQHAHEAGLIHRDIKPGNILIDRQGLVKILDMGLARFFNDDEDMLTKKYDENVLGTADYLAPEQAIDSHGVDGRADIYSLGATFYFMLTASQPFTDGTVAQKLIWHQTRHPKSIRDIRPEVPEGVCAIVEKMMAKDPNDRYQNPMELADALSPFVQTPIDPPPEREMPTLSAAAQAVGGGPTSFTVMPRQVPNVPRPASGSGTKQGQGSGSRKKASGNGRGSQTAVPALSASNSVSDSEQTKKRSTAAPVIEKLGAEPQVWESLAADTNDATRGNTDRQSNPPKSGKKPRQLEPLPLPEPREDRRVRRKKSGLGVSFTIIALILLALGASYAVYVFVIRTPDSSRKNDVVGPGSELSRLTVARKEGVGQYQRVKDALENAKEGQHIVILDPFWEEELTVNRDLGRRVKGVVIEGADNRTTTWRFPIGQQRRKMIELFNASGLTIRNLTFEGNKDISFGIVINGVCPGLTIEDVTIRDMKDAAIRFDNCHGTEVSPVVVQRTQIIGNKSYLANGCGIAFETTPIPDDPKPANEYIAIRDCLIEGPFSTENKESAFNFSGSALNIDIEKNRVWQTGDGISFKEAKPGISLRLRVRNNTFHSQNIGIRFKNAGFLLQKQNIGNQKIEIERNYFYKNNAIVRSDDKSEISPFQSIPADNARHSNSKEGFPSLNCKVIDVPEFPLNTDESRDFLRYKKNSPLYGNGQPIGAPPVE